MPTNKLKILNISENNLKNIDLEIAHDQLIGISGLSGSGKSTLAFDTIYAEGQRRYLETFSPYVRQFLDKIKKPTTGKTSNLRPALAIQQKTKIHSARSTVGSLTDMNDYLSLLFASLATPHSDKSGKPFLKYSANSLVQFIKEYKFKTETFYITTKLILEKSPKKKKAALDTIITLGYARFMLPDDLSIYKFSEDLGQAKSATEIYIIIDRLKTSKISTDRLGDAINQAYQMGRGCLYLIENSPEIPVQKFSEYFYDPQNPEDSIQIKDVKASLFSNSNPLGACPECKGFGNILRPDPLKIIPDQLKSLEENAIDCWKGDGTRNLKTKMFAFAQANKIDLATPWKSLTKAKQELLFTNKSREYVGINHWFQKIQKKSYKTYIRLYLTRYRTAFCCEECQGSGLQQDSLMFRLNKLNFHQAQAMEISQLKNWLAEIKSAQTAPNNQLSSVFDQLEARLEFLDLLGLGYLQIRRLSKTLSGGETQRVNLATALGSDLTSTQFVLDEPSVGLHPHDSDKLMVAIRNLQQKGNSVVMVEHDPDCLTACDQIIELGPEAGSAGGEIIYQGSTHDWPHKFLAAQTLTKPKTDKWLEVKVKNFRNIQNLSVKIPINHLTTLCGVSGSGKSSLALDVILKTYEEQSSGLSKNPDYTVKGLENFDQVLAIDQSPLAKSPRANIATYAGLWDKIRTELAKTQLAEQKLLTKSSFSFNVEGGRCPNCQGAGQIKEEMQFLHDVYLTCEVCLGKRFQESVLAVEYQGKNVDQWLNTTVAELHQELISFPDIQRTTETLLKLGLGHLRLGHSLRDLSGGEAQRLKLVPFISKTKNSPSLLIFDEPSTGLSQRDVKSLILVLRELSQLNHTVLCIEHNQDILLSSDYLIELGPGGGKAGGELIKSAHPTEFLKTAATKKSLTAKYLVEYQTKYASPKKLNKSTKQKTLTTKNTSSDQLMIRGAKTHNLKNIDLDLPHNKIIAVTGVSGSGKSTIVKDVIYSEGQRKYLDCLSPYARQFIKELSKPDVLEIKNLRPSIYINQYSYRPGKLSTIATVSEIYNYIRLLYAKLGTQYCTEHPASQVVPKTAEDIAAELNNFTTQNVKILIPVINHKKGHHRAVFKQAMEQEISSVRVDGQFCQTSSVLEGLSRHKVHSIDFVYADLIPSRIPKDLLIESIKDVLSASGGTLIAIVNQEEYSFSNRRGCPICSKGFGRPDPEDFSFNSKRGKCNSCEGSGQKKDTTCSSCKGTRLKDSSLSVKINNLNIAELTEQTASQLLKTISTFKFNKRETELATTLLSEITNRIDKLIELGLDYLPLNRSCRQLSRGELQRLRLSTAIGSPLSGVLYIFDEPSAGLHPLDNKRVLKQFTQLKKNHNSIYIIEHDPETIKIADHLLEVGPGGGKDGGQIIFNDQLNKYQFKTNFESDLISTKIYKKPKLTIKTQGIHNLTPIELSLPLQSITSFIGVSGAGKSSLLNGCILPAIDTLKKSKWKNEITEITSDLTIDRLVEVDQSPIGKNSRSTPASYLKMWDEIRQLFAKTTQAKIRGWNAGYFSYNSKTGGRCKECSGRGQLKLEMNFLADAFTLCPECQGNRYSDEALSAKYLDLNISDVLNLTFTEAKQIFTNYPKIYKLAKTTCDLGLGYLTLGQPSTTLSGGESQRIKLATELAAKSRGHSLYILDEPTVGLHREDVKLLISVLQNLIKRGDTVFIIEHDEQVVRESDFLVELGPGAGENGGQIIFADQTNKILKSKSPWGRILNKSLPIKK